MPKTRSRRALGEVPAAPRRSAQERTDDLQLKLLEGGVLLGVVSLLGGGGYWLVSRTIREAQKNKVERESFTTGADPGAHAMGLHAAMNRSGWEWARGLDTTDVQGIYNVIYRVKSQAEWREVVIRYGKLYGRSLGRDLEQELNASEFAQAQKLVNAKKLK